MPVVNREVVLPVPRERAWELVTEPEEMETWLAEDVEFEAEEGAPLRTEDAARSRGRRRARRRRGADRLHLGRLDGRVACSRTIRRHPLRRHGAPVRGRRRRVGADDVGARLRRRTVPGVDDRIGAVFAALADPTRRQVVRSLSRQPDLTASRLAGELPMTRQAVTKHLVALDRAGLVERPPRGPRDPLHAHARAAGRRDALDGRRRRGVGRAPARSWRSGAEPWPAPRW